MVIKTALDIVENKKLTLIMKEFGLSPDTLEKVEGIILMDSSYFDGELTDKNVAKISRDCLMKIIEDLYQSLPDAHINSYNDVYEEEEGVFIED